MSSALVGMVMVLSVGQVPYDAPPPPPPATVVIQLPKGAVLTIDKLMQPVSPSSAAFPPWDQPSPGTPYGASVMIIPPHSHLTLVAGGAAPVLRPGDRSVIFLPTGGLAHIGSLHGGMTATHPYAIRLGASRLILEVPPEQPVQQPPPQPYYPSSPSYGAVPRFGRF